MLSDTVLIALISTAGTVITTVVSAISGHKTREHVREVKRDVKDIKESQRTIKDALYIGSGEEPPVNGGDRAVKPFNQPTKER